MLAAVSQSNILYIFIAYKLLAHSALYTQFLYKTMSFYLSQYVKKPETACFHFPLDQHDKKHAIFILWRPRTNYSCFLSFLCSITKNTHCNNNPKTMFLVTARLLLQRNFRIRLIKKRENRKSKKSILCSFFQGKRLILGILSMPNGNKKVYGNCYTMSANNTNTNTDL